MGNDSVRPIVWSGNRLELLDQRYLPHQQLYRECTTFVEVRDAIRDMVVRGAPAIGVSAAFGMALAARTAERDGSPLESTLKEAATALKESRPTAVNLAWAVDRMSERFRQLTASSESAIADALTAFAIRLFDEDLAANRRIGGYGQMLLAAHATVLTHCNAGALATAGHGTALGVIRSAIEAGKKIAVYADETRPYMQGARLTAWELAQDNIDVTLITDSMAGHFFQQGKFDAVFVGADRIAANGDTANKIGTYTVAVLADAHQIPFYVAAPLTTIDLDCATGAGIPIEERAASEVLETTGFDRDGALRTVRTAPDDAAVRHPAFDVTPARLVTAIVTDQGIARPPYEQSLRSLFE